MARIPEHDIQRLKDEISVLRLVESAGVELRKVGKDWAGRCPFHADDTASLVITPSKNLWHCFGCQIGGGVVDWVMKLKGVSFRHAVELLKDDSALAAGGVGAVDGPFGSRADAGAGYEPARHSTVRSLAAPVALDADDRALLLQVVDYYRLSLKQSPEALVSAPIEY
jgi:DNA primase